MMETLQNVFSQLERMQWSDYLDICVVAVILYWLIPVLRASGTMRVAKTVGALLVITWITDLFNLYTLNFLLRELLAVGVIAVVVLFQPELRRMLDHLGKVSIKTLLGIEKPVGTMEPAIVQTVRACEIMSRERVGALIVFQRETPLDEYFKTGTLIDGQVSEQLLRNIFFPKASLHDGAMIVRGGRVAAAGCVLPLSDSNRLSADLGTRHRAGVGMSEASDAVVVIVSEETGTISVAVGGMLKRHLAPQTLERLLRSELCPEEAPAKENLVVRLKQRLSKKKGGEEK